MAQQISILMNVHKYTMMNNNTSLKIVLCETGEESHQLLSVKLNDNTGNVI